MIYFFNEDEDKDSNEDNVKGFNDEQIHFTYSREDNQDYV